MIPSARHATATAFAAPGLSVGLRREGQVGQTAAHVPLDLLSALESADRNPAAPVDLTRLLRELIALPSVNPAFVSAGDPWAGEARVGDFILSVAARAGLAVDRREVLPGRPNVYVVLEARGRPRGRVLLAPHLDTVGADRAGFVPRVKGGRLHGRGACDTKGSVAAMLGAVLSVAQSGRRPDSTEILLVGLMDEENEQLGSRALVESGLGADLAVVGEPTGLRVVTAHKGDVWLEVETRGRAAHGATPEHGINAVRAMAGVVERIEGEYATQLRERVHPLLGHPTVNVGAIAGGVQPNIVPDACRIQVDRRTLPGETPAGVRRELRALLGARPVSGPVRVRDLKAGICPPLETSFELPLVRQLGRCAGQSEPAGVHFFCDAAILGQGGIPSVVFGPGDIAQAHTADEWVSLRALASAGRILTRFLRELP